MALSQFIEQQSAALPKTWRSRQLKTGVQHYAVRNSIVSDGAEKTGWAILRTVLRAVQELRKMPLLAVATDSEPTAPPVAVNSEELCRTGVRGRRVSARTIRNHIGELLHAGIILRKQFRGRQRDFYVWVNPIFLWETGEKPAETASKPIFESAQNSAVCPPKGTNFPPKGVHEPSQATEIETGPVDKLPLGSTREAPNDLQATPSGYTGLPGQAAKAAQVPKNEAGRGAAPSSTQTPQTRLAVPDGPKTALAKRQYNMVHEFWWAAQRELYTPQGKTFTEQQGRLALNAIYFGVYGGFPHDWPLHLQERYHEQALERIGLAAGYFARNHHKYAPTPYAEHLPGAGYFDAENKRGFAGTLAWFATHLAHRQQRALADGLRRARRDLRQHAQGTAPKRAQQKTTLELYRYHEERMRKLGTGALERFYQHFSRPVVA